MKPLILSLLIALNCFGAGAACGSWAGGSGGGGGVWGSITGTLGDQTDLDTALAAKFPLAGGVALTGYIATIDGAAATPSIRLGDPANLTGFYTTGVNIEGTCAGSRCFDITINQFGSPKLIYLNVPGTGGIDNVIQTGSGTDTLLVTGSVGGATTNGAGIKLGGDNLDTTEFWNAGVNTAHITAAGGFYGYLQHQVAATATTITRSQCGATFINSGAVQMELPEASTVIGCRLTFITGNASNFDINPDNADQILVQTDAAGDAIRNATLGNSITIEAISASQWAPVSVGGTWTDIN